MKAEALQAVHGADVTEVLRVLDRHFGELTYTLRALFRDEQRKVLAALLSSAQAETESAFRQVYDHHAPLMRFLAGTSAPVPASFLAAAELVVNANLKRALKASPIDARSLADYLEDARTWSISLDTGGLAFVAAGTLAELARAFRQDPGNVEALAALVSSVASARQLPFAVDLAEPQNEFWSVLRDYYPGVHQRSVAADEAARAWIADFRALGDDLSMRVD
jgi:hypothetical protein